MPVIYFNEAEVETAEHLTVLESLENAGFSIPNSCRSGLCHSCMMQADGNIPPSAQQGLTQNQKMQQYFLACCCFPKSDMSVNLIGADNKRSGLVVDKTLLNGSVLKLVIEVDFKWFPGQYLNLWRDESLCRSYSIASRCDEQRLLEVHIKRHDQGQLSQWLHDDLAKGDSLTLSQPTGNCFYTDDHAGKPLLMAATGTGLAPLYGVVQEALHLGHSENITLYAAAGDPASLYYVEELMQLASKYKQLSYIPVVRRDADKAEFTGAGAELVEDDLVDLFKQTHTDLKGHKAFLCGSPEMVKELQRHCFFSGAAVADILVDAFVMEKPKTETA